MCGSAIFEEDGRSAILEEDYPEFLLFDFLARGLAGLDDEAVAGFFARLRLLIELIRSERA